MPTIHLTKGVIDRLPVLSKDTVYWDGSLPGFGVKITPKGKKVFLVLYRVGGAGSRLRKYTIGPYGRVTLVMARAQAQKIFAARRDGRDPAAEKRKSRRRLVADQISELVGQYLEERVSRLRSHRKEFLRFDRDVLPFWGSNSVHQLKKRDVIDLVTQVSQRSADSGYRLLKALRTFFKWCVGRGVIELSRRRAFSPLIADAAGTGLSPMKNSRRFSSRRDKGCSPSGQLWNASRSLVRGVRKLLRWSGRRSTSRQTHG